MAHSGQLEDLDHLMAQVSRLHHTRAHALLRDIGLHRGQPPLLFALWDEDGQSQAALAERLGIAPATLTRMVQRMERAGFVERRADPADERLSRVHLTEAGRALYRFRFTPTLRGEWRFTTASGAPGLDALSGTVTAAPAVREGPLSGGDGRVPVVPSAGTGRGLRQSRKVRPGGLLRGHGRPQHGAMAVPEAYRDI